MPSRQNVFKIVTSVFFWVAFLGLFLPFYAEILMAGIFALAMDPILGRLFKSRHWRWRTMVAVTLLAMFVVLAVPLTMVGYKLYAYVIETSRGGFQNTPLFQTLVQAKADLVTFGNHALEKVGFKDSVDLAGISEDFFGRATNTTLQVLSEVVQKLPNLLLSLFVFCAALYFFLAEAGPLRHIFLRQRVLDESGVNRFLGVLQQSCYNTVVSSVLISVIQATIVALGAVFISRGDFAVIWVVTFFCSFVPVIGAGPVGAVLGLYQLLIGKYGAAIGFGVVGLVAGTTDNLVRPFLISSGEEDLHPIVSLLAIIGALVVFGMPGLFFGPVIASVAVKIIPTMINAPEPVITASGKDREKTTT